MRLCHPLSFVWHFCFWKVLLSHRTHHMASAASNLKQKKLLAIASGPSCHDTKTQHSLLSIHQNKVFHDQGDRRWSHTEVFSCVPHDYECSDIEVCACVSDGHGCSSSSRNGDHIVCLSKFQEDASDDAGATSVSLHDGHAKYANNRIADGVRSSCITDCCDASSQVEEMRCCNGDFQKGHGDMFNVIGAEKVSYVCNGDSKHASDEIEKPAKRPFCKRCEKAQELCICNRFKGIVLNKIKITILQNPKEKHHAVGSARVALLGLENVSLIDVPEIYSKESFRIRPKVPGSKRSLAGRGGKKMLLNGGKVPVMNTVPSQADILQMQNLLTEIFVSPYDHLDACDVLHLPKCPNENGERVCEVTPQDRLQDSLDSEGTIGAKNLIMHKSRPPEETSGLFKGNAVCGGQSNEDNKAIDGGSLYLEELEPLIPPGVALLYPSDKAIELLQPLQPLQRHNGQEIEVPCHLIVLDGTWSKARRIYFENPWLEIVPHYKLSISSPSLYEGVRKQPKTGCLSTLESIVYALKILEPETVGLDGLLEVFDSMVEDQRRCKQMKCVVQECGLE